LARELRLAGLVIQPPSAGFSFYDHYQYLSCQSEVWHHISADRIGELCQLGDLGIRHSD